ncbi:hypothetical protein HBNXHr_1397 [Halorhabdus sp. BNX81]|nr:hypothetical protein HBNXHr_1397 [Halorhabdus sp. BNX81]
MAGTRQSDPNPAVQFTPFLGLLLVVIGLEVWERRWTAWSLAVIISGEILITSLHRMAFTFDVVVAVIIVGYLFVKLN